MSKLEWRCQQRLDFRDSEIFNLLKDLPVETLLYGMARTEHEETRRIISHFITHLRQVHSLLRGSDLLSMGIEPGPVYREVFEQLLAERLDGKLLTREDEVRFVTRHFVGKCTKTGKDDVVC
jgi:tRNA nucleotidyltransferase (CCA-adding enzyme)